MRVQANVHTEPVSQIVVCWHFGCFMGCHHAQRSPFVAWLITGYELGMAQHRGILIFQLDDL
jgi:hypothetical protein